MGQPRLEWAIRDTFLAYLQAIEAVVDLRGGAMRTEDGAIAFPLAQTAPDLLQARGRFRAVAHGGALDLLIAEPALRRDADGWGLEWASGDGLRTRARLLGEAPSDILAGDRAFRDVALTAAAAELFGGNYAPWARMAPVRLFLAR